MVIGCLILCVSFLFVCLLLSCGFIEWSPELVLKLMTNNVLFLFEFVVFYPLHFISALILKDSPNI